MRSIKTAIIGCGARAGGHANAARNSGALELTWACDCDESRARESADKWGVKCAVDYREALDDADLEAVLIVTDVGSHVPIARDALRAGKHIIVEKPLGDDASEAGRLVAEHAESGLVAYVSLQLRFSARYAPLKTAAAAIDPVQVYFGRQRKMMKPQFLNQSLFCGIMDCCAHDFDLVSWFMGRPPVAVSAAVRRNTFTRDTGAADVISALLDFGEGRTASVVSSIGAEEVGDKCDIVGARGNLTLARSGELSGVLFDPFQSDGDKKPLPFGETAAGNPDVLLQQAFARQVRGEGTSEAASLGDGLNSLLVTLGCLKSAEENRRVELAELL